MKRVVLTYGLLSGAVVAVLASINLLVIKSHSEVLGYTTMVLAFLLVFFGVRSYRDHEGGGTITFGRAFAVGILIALITCAVYVISCEIIYFNFMPDFVEKYSAEMIHRAQARGASAAEVARLEARMKSFAEMYRNPLINVGMTFMEIFPVGLIMTLVSAAILRRRAPSGATTAVTA